MRRCYVTRDGRPSSLSQRKCATHISTRWTPLRSAILHAFILLTEPEDEELVLDLWTPVWCKAVSDVFFSRSGYRWGSCWSAWVNVDHYQSPVLLKAMVLVCVGLVFVFFEGYHTNLVFFSLSLKLTLKPANNTSNSSLERSCDACGFVFSLSFVKLQ